jgi:hypothetical protein
MMGSQLSVLNCRFWFGACREDGREWQPAVPGANSPLGGHESPETSWGRHGTGVRTSDGRTLAVEDADDPAGRVMLVQGGTHNRYQQAWTSLHSCGRWERFMPGRGRCWTSWLCFAVRGSGVRVPTLHLGKYPIRILKPVVDHQR